MELLLLLLVFGAVMAEEDEPRDGVTYTNIKDVPVVESFAGSLLQSTELKPQVLGAFNISAEVDDWISSGKPTTLGFVEDNDVVKYGIIAANQFVPYSNYIGGIRFHFYNKYDEMDLKGFPFIRVGVLSEHGWDPKLPLKVLVHGFGNNIKSPSIQLIKNAYLKKGKYNVIGVDWGRLAGAPLYVATRVHVSAVATRLAHLMDSLVKAKLTEVPLIHLVGYDMGAHVAGIVGKSMAVGKPKRITGLDPNLPLFTLTKSEGKLDKTDADIVDVIHTSPGFIGFEEALGKVDFYPSGSLDCSADVFGACAHARSYEIFAQSIEKSLPAHYCGATFKEVKECTTTKEVKKTATMGNALQFDKEGTYTFSWVKMAM